MSANPQTTRAYTRDEITDMYLSHMLSVAQYWSKVESDSVKTVYDRCEGVVFSILCLLDGSTNLPSTKVVVQPHKDDKKYNQKNGDNWFEPKTEIDLIHEYLHRVK